jgi:divalent metal cation (Fe/Co/Zn/Cd) transporter
MAVASVATLALLRYQKKVVAETGSTAIRGDSLHYATDLAMNAAVALAMVASWGVGWLWVDPVLGLVVAVLAGRSAMQIG